tara:strand:- start:65 stop:781 length:717 start_codon:yes stop_codon:yes gene_type:complete
MFNAVDLLGFKINTQTFKEIYDSNKKTIATINSYSYSVAKKDKVFAEALKASDVLLPDGIGIVWATKFLHNKEIQRRTGPECMDFVLEMANLNSEKVFFLGSTDYVLEKIKKKVRRNYPNIAVGTLSPPFVEQLSSDENKIIIGEINSFNPDHLFVGMTAPKQEKWVFTTEKKLNSKKIYSVGAAFDWFAETKKKPSKFAEKYHLVTFERALREPRILLRILQIFPLISNIIFEKTKR